MARQRRGCPLRARRSRDHIRATDQHNQIQVELNSFLDSFLIEEKGSNENNSAPLPTQEQDLQPYRFDPETQLIHIRVKYCLARISSLSLTLPHSRICDHNYLLHFRHSRRRLLLPSAISSCLITITVPLRQSVPQPRRSTAATVFSVS